MSEFPHVRGIDALPERVLALAVHPGDAVRGCGGTLGLHTARGDRVRVVVLTGGGEGVEEAAREAETRSALGVLGVQEVEFLGLVEGTLEAGRAALFDRVAELLASDAPQLLYAPSPFEPGSDHRALMHPLAFALRDGDLAQGRTHLYPVHHPIAANYLVDVAVTSALKQEALERVTPPEATGAGRTRAGARAGAPGATLSGAPGSVEAFVRLAPHPSLRARSALLQLMQQAGRMESWLDAVQVDPGTPTVSAVISTWNEREDLRENLEALEKQTREFDEVVVVDNASTDGTAQMVREDFPWVRLVVTPHSAYGACETFNMGFATAGGDFVAILDDDVVLPPDWLQATLDRMLAEPQSTAVVSTKIVEPGMPQGYLDSPRVNSERYMSTFRGCASLARAAALAEAGGYDERLFIYGNERDLTCRLLNLGYRVLQYPGAQAFHKTPFGIKMGRRSLYFHARNAWLTMLKYAPAGDLFKLPFLVLTRVLLRRRSREEQGEIADATGTIGIGRSIRETKGAWWVLLRACFGVLRHAPYCLRRRAPCRHPDFELPIR